MSAKDKYYKDDDNLSFISLTNIVEEIMKTGRFLGLFCYIVLVILVLSHTGCGGSNMNNPVSDIDQTDESDDSIVELEDTVDVIMEEAGELNVSVTVTRKTVKPGEQVELTASVEGVRGTSVVINWLNITGYGTLSATNETRVTWTAPNTLGEDKTRVEVLQLVVTVISEIVSVNASVIKTDTQILSDTKEILLQVVRE